MPSGRTFGRSEVKLRERTIECAQEVRRSISIVCQLSTPGAPLTHARHRRPLRATSSLDINVVGATAASSCGRYRYRRRRRRRRRPCVLPRTREHALTLARLPQGSSSTTYRLRPLDDFTRRDICLLLSIMRRK